jgi:hypothetical protein
MEGKNKHDYDGNNNNDNNYKTRLQIGNYLKTGTLCICHAI